MPKHRGAGPVATSWVGRFGSALSMVFFALSVLMALVLVLVPFISGSQTYTVLTSSMKPGFPPGTFLVVKPEPFDRLRNGDVITYQIESGKPDVVTHRIVSESAAQSGERTLITKGDNNRVEDPVPVIEAQVRGKLFYAVPYAGFAANAIGQSGKGLLLQTAATALIAYGVYTLGRGVLSVRRKLRARHSPAAPRRGRRRARG